jgi:hypothetical protein
MVRGGSFSPFFALARMVLIDVNDLLHLSNPKKTVTSTAFSLRVPHDYRHLYETSDNYHPNYQSNKQSDPQKICGPYFQSCFSKLCFRPVYKHVRKEYDCNPAPSQSNPTDIFHYAAFLISPSRKALAAAGSSGNREKAACINAGDRGMA